MCVQYRVSSLLSLGRPPIRYILAWPATVRARKCQATAWSRVSFNFLLATNARPDDFVIIHLTTTTTQYHSTKLKREKKGDTILLYTICVYVLGKLLCTGQVWLPTRTKIPFLCFFFPFSFLFFSFLLFLPNRTLCLTFFNRIRALIYQEQILCPRQILVQDLFLEASSTIPGRKEQFVPVSVHSFSNPVGKAI